MMPDLVEMVKVNLFRTLPPQADDFDPEEVSDIIPSPHLCLCLAFPLSLSLSLSLSMQLLVSSQCTQNKPLPLMQKLISEHSSTPLA
jgi:hypothetical protein